ncbi:hypothetical protein QZH41_011349, partial [Actinostola sp. cb2023]
QKDIMKEWKGMSTQYAKNMKALEESSTKAGTYFFLQNESREADSLPGVQNDDIVLWQQHISHGQEQIKSCLTKLREIIKDHKNINKFTKAGKISLKRKSVRKFIKLEELSKHLKDYEALTDGLAQNIPMTDKLLGLGNTRVVGGELDEGTAIKLRDDLVTLNSRWNRLNERILRYVDRCDKFVIEILNDYTALGLWMVKCDNMIQWLTECEKLLEQEPKIGTDHKTLEDQQQDNDEFLSEGREYQPSAFDVLSSGDKMYNRNRLDKYDLQYVNKTVIALRNRWNVIEEHLEERHTEIKSRLDKFKKSDTADDLAPWKEKADSLHKSLSHSQSYLDSIDARLKDDDKYETLRQCTQEIQQVEQQLLYQSSEALTEVSSAGAAWTNKKQLSDEDDQKVQQTVNVLHDKMSGLEEVVKIQKERLQRSTANLMNQSVADCEQSINDLDNTSLENFSSVGSDVQQVQGQIKELQVFEEKMEEEETKLQQVVKQFNEAAEESMLDEPNKTKISYRVKEIDWRYKELWREHDASKQRILQALLVYSDEVLGDANNWLDDAESRADKISQSDELDRKSLEKALEDQESLTQDTTDNEQKVKTAAFLGKTIVKDEVLQDQTLSSLKEEMELLERRLENLKEINSDNYNRLKEALSQRSLDDLQPVEVSEVVEANDFEAELEALPDDIQMQPRDEGFGEGEHSDTPTDIQVEVESDDLGPKIAEFHGEVQFMNTWIDESNKMADEFYKSMHDKDAWVLQEKIEARYEELVERQEQVDYINELGKDIVTQSTNQDTTKTVNEEMVTLNNKWRECQSMLDTACEVQVQRTRRRGTNGGCCLMTVIRRKISTICTYN